MQERACATAKRRRAAALQNGTRIRDSRGRGKPRPYENHNEGRLLLLSGFGESVLERGDFFAGDVAVAAGGEGAEFDIGDGDAAEFVDVMSGGEEGFAKCVFASADSLHFPPAGGHAFGAGEFDGGAAFEFANSSRIGRWINFAEINLAEIVGAHDAIGEFTVIGEEKEAGGVIFEASDGENASGEAAEEI